MKRLLLCLSLLTWAAGCSGSADSGDLYRPTSSIKEIMDSIIDPSADFVWDSVAISVDAEGIHENFPRTDDDWAAVRRNAVAVIEGSNLLLIPGRRVAPAGAESENPEIELEPEQIQALIDEDREAWIERAHELHDVAMDTLAAIDARDTEELLNAGGPLDRACEGCHITYWYPNDEGARELYEQSLEY